jgi:hypothetical protein
VTNAKQKRVVATRYFTPLNTRGRCGATSVFLAAAGLRLLAQLYDLEPDQVLPAFLHRSKSARSFVSMSWKQRSPSFSSQLSM